MNPYVYKRKRLNLSLEKSGKQPSLITMIKEVFSSNISSSIAFTAIAFGAMSIITLTFTSQAEIAIMAAQPEASYGLRSEFKQLALQGYSAKSSVVSGQSMVLGETIYPETLLTSSWNSTIKIKARPLEFNTESGKWVYEINWSRKKNAVGSLYVDGAIVDGNAAQIGAEKITVYAGKRVKVEFYSQANKKGTLLVRKYFNVKEKLSSGSTACTMEVKLCEDGKTYVGRSGSKCEFQACPPVEKIICPSLMCAAPPLGYHYESDPNVKCGCGKLVKDGFSGGDNSTSTTANVSFRYLKDEITKSGWVAIREMEFFGPDGQQIKPITPTVSCDWCGYGSPPNYSVGAKGVMDDNWETVWNAGETADNCNWYSSHYRDDGIYGVGCSPAKIRKAWVQVDFGSEVKISKIRIQVMGDSPDRIDELKASSNGKDFVLIGKLETSQEGPVRDGQWIEYLASDSPKTVKASPGEKFSSPPTATFTVNGQQEAVIKVGEKINFAWESKYADVASIQISEADDASLSKIGKTEDYLCNQTSYKNAQSLNPFYGVTWENSNKIVLSGKKELLVQGCYAGKVVSLTYTAKQRNGGLTASKTVKLKINGASSSTTSVIGGGVVQPSTQVINLTANGQTSLTVNVGDTVNYIWSAVGNGYNLFSSTYTANRAEYCSNGVSQGVNKPWIANTSSGSQTVRIDECQSGTTYTMTFKARSSSGSLPEQTATMIVNVNNLSMTPYFKVNNSTNITAKVGEEILYHWWMPGKSSVSSSYTTDKADVCIGGSLGANISKPWTANSITGSVKASVQACQTGVTYYISIIGDCPGCGGSTTQSVTVRVIQ